MASDSRPTHANQSQDLDDVTTRTRTYYDAPDVDTVYRKLWGGTTINIGLYHDPRDPIALASQRTIEAIASLTGPITAESRIIDLGAGYGGAARYLAHTYGCHVTCINLSGIQNERNKELCKQEGLEHLVTVLEGSFEYIPVPDNSFDIVWSQDAFVHSGDREKVVMEIDRILVIKGGTVVFTDPMERDGVPREQLKGVLGRLPVERLGSVPFYQRTFRKRGFFSKGFRNWSEDMRIHYGRVLQELEQWERKKDADDGIGKAFIDNMKVGLRAWVEGTRKGDLVWGCSVFYR